jgi:hypothetical protein
MFFGDDFGLVYHLLAAVLDPATKARWQTSLSRAAAFMASKGTLNWYTNGNINIGQTEFFWLAWQATGNPVYQQDEEKMWATTLLPNQTQWPGAGLVITKQPTAADGSDGAGYLAEIGAGGTGFDPEYTTLQLEVLSGFYLLSHDPRALRIANLEINQEMPRVNSSWMLDTSGGTRHTELNRSVNFMTPAFTVLALDGGRSDLAGDVVPELVSEQADYNQSWQAYNPVYRRALGTDLAISALAAAGVTQAPAKVAAPAPAATPATTPTRTLGSAPAPASTATAAPTPNPVQHKRAGVIARTASHKTVKRKAGHTAKRKRRRTAKPRHR